jgi:hypothetical protein
MIGQGLHRRIVIENGLVVVLFERLGGDQFLNLRLNSDGVVECALNLLIHFQN